MRSLHPPRAGERRQPRRDEPRVVLAAAPTATTNRRIETLDGPEPARVSWRRADVAVPASLTGVLAWLHEVFAAAPRLRWWHEHDPLLIQRGLFLVNALVVVLLVLQLL